MSECKYKANDGECLYEKRFPYKEYCVKGPCPHDTPQTNFDWIKSLSVEKLANVITDDWCEILCGSPSICDGQCEGKMLSWLKSPVAETD